MTERTVKHGPPQGPPVRYCLRMVAGPTVGKTWLISEPLMRIGRTLGCHIRIEDTHVSRVQCELSLEGERLRMRNSGQRNPTAINGVIREEAFLQPGDMISCAGIRLVLDNAIASDDVAEGAPADSRTTQGFADSLHLRAGFDAAAFADDPSLTEDLHGLLSLVRSLGRAESLDALVGLVTRHLVERLRLEKLWVAWWLRAHNEMVLFPPASPDETKTAPFDVMRETCAGDVGVMIAAGPPRRHHLLAAPLMHAGECFGVLVAGRPVAWGPFAEKELQYLVATADCCAPMIRAAERLEQMQRDAQAQAATPTNPLTMLGDSAAMRSLHAEIRRAAIARVNVIIQGETGVGKELAARMLHDLSVRGLGPYVAVNCAAISTELFESEMFGHERGAFTGAARRKKGLFELAQGGTLFLDEVTELSPANQAHLLRAVDIGAIRPVGSEEEIKVDVRVICATNRPLPDPDQSYFRADLYHRLAGVTIRITPLREHKEDIVDLSNHFLRAASPHAPSHPKEFTKEAIDKLLAYHWPGNVRELRNAVERSCYLAQAAYISSHDILIGASPAESSAHKEIVSFDQLERQHLLDMLRHHNNCVIDVARAMGISRSAVYYKLARHGIRPRSVPG